jgi:hypothetical protein
VARVEDPGSAFEGSAPGSAHIQPSRTFATGIRKGLSLDLPLAPAATGRPLKASVACASGGRRNGAPATPPQPRTSALSLVDAAGKLDQRPAPSDELRRRIISMRATGKAWKAIAAEFDIAESTAI